MQSFLGLFTLQDVRLKVVILEFIATAVETQPGLIELFLDLSSKNDKVRDDYDLELSTSLFCVTATTKNDNNK